MKKLLLSLLAFASMAMLFNACQSKDPKEPEAPAGVTMGSIDYQYTLYLWLDNDLNNSETVTANGLQLTTDTFAVTFTGRGTVPSTKVEQVQSDSALYFFNFDPKLAIDSFNLVFTPKVDSLLPYWQIGFNYKVKAKIAGKDYSTNAGYLCTAYSYDQAVAMCDQKYSCEYFLRFAIRNGRLEEAFKPIWLKKN